MQDSKEIIGGKTQSLLDKISFVLLLAATAISPLFFVPVSFISTQFGTSLLFAFSVIISIILYIISRLTSGTIELPEKSKYILGSILLVPIMYTLAGVANGFSRMSFFGYTFDQSTVGFILLSFIYLFLISILFRTKKKVLYSYFAFVGVSIVFALFLLIRIIFGAKVLAFGIFTDPTSSVIGSWNNVGIFFGVGLLLSLFTFEMLRVSRIMKILLSVAMLFSLFFLAIVNFQLIWVIMAICAFMFTVYIMYNGSIVSLSIKQRLSRITLYPAIVFIISVVFIIWGNGIGGYLSNHLKITNVEVRPSFAATMNIARETIKARPLFGSGPNTFVTQWLSFKPDDITTTIFWNTDFTNGIGLIPTYAVTTGIIGVLSWLIFLGVFMYFGIRSIFAKIDDALMRYLLTSSFFVSLFLWIMTLVYVPSTVIFILAFFFTGLFFASVYTAGVVSVSSRAFSISPRSGFLSSLIMVALFIASISLGYGLFKNSLSLWYFQKSSYALNTEGSVEKAEDYMGRAIATVPYDLYYRALSEIEIFKLGKILSQDPKTTKIEDAQKQFSQALTAGIKAGISAKDADPTNYLNWIALARVYEAASAPQLQQGAYESAQLAYSEALRRNPKNPGILVLFSRLAINHGDLAQARAYALQAIQAKQNYLDAYYLLTQIEVANKNLKGAIDSATAASILSPNDSGVFFQLGLLKYNAQDFAGAIDALSKAVGMTPDYANAKYFLGLSYEATGQHAQAIAQFTDLKRTNPDSKEVDTILTSLMAGKSIFAPAQTAPEKKTKLPLKETNQ